MTYQQWVHLHENPDDEVRGHFKKVQPPSVQSEQKKYFDELRERIGEDKFYEMECNYQEYLRLKLNDE